MIAWLAPGQGMERPGMGRDVALAWPEAARLLDGLEPGLESTELVQPALTATALAAAAALGAEGVPCDLVAGHSVGELAAWSLAGGLDPHEAIALARIRGRLMAEAAAARPGAMWVVDELPDPLPDGLVVAVHNPGQGVLSGPGEPPRSARAVLTSGPWHSPAMEPALAPFARAVARVPRRELVRPLVSGQDGRPTTDDVVVRRHLVAQLTSPVRWTEVLAAIVALGTTDVVLLGPGKVLASHLGLACPGTRVHRTDRAVDLRATARALAR